MTSCLFRMTYATIVMCLLTSGFCQAVTKPMNVLFVSLDDLNDWIEPLGGHPQARTPHLSRLARQGAYFTHAYCASPMCNPSRTAIMTGLAPYSSGVYSNYQDWRELIPNRVSLGAYFRKHGYHATGAGKIYHYHMVDPECWDSYWPSQENNMPKEYLPQDYDDEEAYRTIAMTEFKDMYRMFDWAPLDINDSQMGDYKSVDYACQQLQQQHDKPFFLACGIYRPHLPWYVPQKYFDMFPLHSIQKPRLLENDLDDVSERARDIAHRGVYHQHVIAADQWKPAVQGYLASIAFADAMLGRLLAALEKSAYAHNTIVMAWSDHGWHLGEKEHWRKFALWENVTRSVLMIKAPPGSPGLPAGTRPGPCHRIVSLQDIYPTLLELCGLPARTDIDGHSLVPLLKNPQASWTYPALTTYDFSEFSVRTERWRYTRLIDGSEELYDHQNDPEEWYNLAADPAHAQTKADLARHIPQQPARLKKTSLKLSPHHIPPFSRRAAYQAWLAHDKDYQYIMKKYW